MERTFAIIAEEAGLPTEILTTPDIEFKELGVDNLLAEQITSRIAVEQRISLLPSIFEACPTVTMLRHHLNALFTDSARFGRQIKSRSSHRRETTFLYPLSTVLQGQLSSSKRILFLLPDGSGSGMAYAMLPKVDADVCIVGLNSPYFSPRQDPQFSVESIAAIWADEILRRQHHGPYYLGGWSAGGYYSFEVAKILLSHGKMVEKLIIIDTPCRLENEAEPMDLVYYLSSHQLLGNWGNEEAKPWVLRHFELSIRAVADYMPTPLITDNPPDVFIIWAKDGVLANHDADENFFELDKKVVRLLMRRNPPQGPKGWNKLLPDAKMWIANTDGNHFTMIHQPHCASLRVLLEECINDHALESWEQS